MRNSVFLAIVLLLPGCTGGSGENHDDADAESLAASLGESETTEPGEASDDDYAAYRTAASLFAKRNPDGSFSEPLVEKAYQQFASDIGRYGVQVEDCLMRSEFGTEPYVEVADFNAPVPEFNIRPEKEIALEQLATYVAVTRAFLDRAGYRPEIYEQPMASFETAMLELAMAEGLPDLERGEMQSELKLSLAQEMDGKRQQLQPDMPYFEGEGGCGAAEGPALFKFDPPDADVWIISKFAFKVCEARFKNPWDIDGRCSRWKQVNDEQRFYLAGNYIYQASWPQGPDKRGSKTVVSPDPDRAITLTIRQ